MRNDEYMRRAIELARRGEGLVNPNPMVGCVVVKDGTIVAEGWHERYGGFHAERNALLSCTEDVTGAELYVTLEPCCHTGKTPPCTDIIIERGIGKVYVGSDDPNPLVAGHGIELLLEAGIEVETHVMKEECDALNEVFFHYITTGLPFVAMKYAMTLDGKIAMAPAATAAGARSDQMGTAAGARSDQMATARTGAVRPPEDRRITGTASLTHVHGLRKRYKAILVGVGTILADNPMLTYRGENAGTPVRDTSVESDIQPIRIILDSHLRTPLTTEVVKTAKEIPTILATLSEGEKGYLSTEKLTKEDRTTKVEKLEEAGVTIWQLPADATGHVDIAALMRRIGDEKIDSVLVEGGAAIHGSLLAHPELISRVYAYISPKLIGGSDALSPTGGAGVPHMSDAIHLRDREIIPLGEDILITGRVN